MNAYQLGIAARSRHRKHCHPIQLSDVMQQAWVIVVPFDEFTVNQVSDTFPDVSAATQMITLREHNRKCCLVVLQSHFGSALNR
eukprot:COSAG02_NODE_5662_length_4145_cov_2.169056_8_plen_84_part_00